MDKKRPLNKRGKIDLPIMAKVVQENKVFPDKIISSNATRASRTAIGICQSARIPVTDINFDSGLYQASLVYLLEKIYSTRGQDLSLMMIGHNPGFTELANHLSGKGLENIATCGLVAMHFNTDKWENINKSNIDFFQYLFPKMYK